MQKVRLFLAIDLDNETLFKLSTAMGELQKIFPEARWCKQNALHLTLKFFGTIPLLSVVEIGNAVNSVVKKMSPIHFKTQGIGGFPSLENPRVLWAGVTNGKEKINFLARRLSEELERYNFIPERKKFVPHITLARFKRGGKLSEDKIEIPNKIVNQSFGITETDEIILYSSDLTPEGPIYSVVDRWEFVR